MNDEILTLEDIAAMYKVSRTYARDKVVKRADFPRPSLALSQKMTRWSRGDVERWLLEQQKKQRRGVPA